MLCLTLIFTGCAANNDTATNGNISDATQSTDESMTEPTATPTPEPTLVKTCLFIVAVLPVFRNVFWIWNIVPSRDATV